MSSIAPDSPQKPVGEFIVAETMQEVPMEDEHVGETPLVYMNLTPMIDMVFNLLFFFVMGAGGGSDAFLQSKLPKNEGVAEGSATETKPAVTLQIRRLRSGSEESDAQYLIKEEGTSVSSYEQLYNKLERLKKRVGDDTPINIEPAANVKYVHAINVFNQATRAGFKTIAFSIME